MEGGNAAVDFGCWQSRMRENQWDVEIRDMRVVVWSDTTILDEGNAVVACHDNESLVGNTSLLQDLHHLSKPLVCNTNGVEVAIDVAIVTEDAGANQFLIILAFRQIPRVMRLSGQMSEKEPLMMLLGVLQGSQEILSQLVFGVAQKLNFFGGLPPFLAQSLVIVLSVILS